MLLFLPGYEQAVDRFKYQDRIGIELKANKKHDNRVPSFAKGMHHISLEKKHSDLQTLNATNLL